jgi:hypothetical protein
MSKAHFFPGHKYDSGKVLKKSAVLSTNGFRVTYDAPPATVFTLPNFKFK